MMTVTESTRQPKVWRPKCTSPRPFVCLLISYGVFWRTNANDWCRTCPSFLLREGTTKFCLSFRLHRQLDLLLTIPPSVCRAWWPLWPLSYLRLFLRRSFFFLESLYQFVVIAWICFLCLPSKQKMLYKQNPWNVERFLTYYNTYEECSYIKREVLQTEKTQCEKEVSCCSKWNHCDCGNIRTD